MKVELSKDQLRCIENALDNYIEYYSSGDGDDESDHKIKIAIKTLSIVTNVYFKGTEFLTPMGE